MSTQTMLIGLVAIAIGWYGLYRIGARWRRRARKVFGSARADATVLVFLAGFVAGVLWMSRGA